jgi:phosphoribosyl 1,2-cyclic phosphate phosphodiesterase
MKVTVLGCGGSAGVPMIGGVWGDCDPTNPRNRRRRAAIAIEHGADRLLIDTPPELHAQLLDADISMVDAVLYTHSHADHCHGLDDLRGLNYHRDGALDVYADAATLDDLKLRFSYAFQVLPDGAPWFRPSLNACLVEPGKAVTVGSSEILPFAQKHGPFQTIGYRIGDFAYSPDVNELDDKAFSALDGLDTWLVDCLRYAPSRAHAWLDLTLSWIERLRPRRAVLTHMATDFDYDRLIAELPDGVEPAYDGMILELPDAHEA